MYRVNVVLIQINSFGHAIRHHILQWAGEKKKRKIIDGYDFEVFNVHV